jgi:peroxiredoxin
MTDVELSSLELLRGRRIPADVELDSTAGYPLALAAYVDLVIYVYPGSAGCIRGDETPLLDAVQHRVFGDRLDDFRACGFAVVGLSSQSIDRQRCVVKSNKLLQALVSDPNFDLAEALGLLTHRFGEVRVYERLTLVVMGGLTSLALYPRPTPESHPTFLVEMLRHDVQRSCCQSPASP